MKYLNTNFLSLSSSANNIGEEIQILAASRFYPSISRYINKERLNTYKVNSLSKIIINGWFMRNYDRFYLSDNLIKPLLISLHITPSIVNKFFTKKNTDFLLNNQPVGARDSFTLNLLKNKGIDAYYSSCLTLTLQKNPKLHKESYILLIDCPIEIEKHLKNITNRPIINLSAEFKFIHSFRERLNIAKLYLKYIQQAYLVVTTRLHGALPALALETKAVFITRNSNTQYERTSDIKQYLPYMSKEEFIEKYKTSEDINNILFSNRYIEQRLFLINKCSSFTGFNSNKSVIPNTTSLEDIELLFKSIKKNGIESKILFDLPIKCLVKNILLRLVFRKNDDDIFE